MKSISKFIPVKDMNQVTLAFLTRQAMIRKNEIAKDKKFPFNISLDTAKWVVRPAPNGNLALLAPITK